MVSDKATILPKYTCHDEKEDGSCEEVYIPKCVDRTVRCEELPNPNSVQSNNNDPDWPAEMIDVTIPNLGDKRVMETEIK